MNEIDPVGCEYLTTFNRAELHAGGRRLDAAELSGAVRSVFASRAEVEVRRFRRRIVLSKFVLFLATGLIVGAVFAGISLAPLWIAAALCGLWLLTISALFTGLAPFRCPWCDAVSPLEFEPYCPSCGRRHATAFSPVHRCVECGAARTGGRGFLVRYCSSCGLELDKRGF